MAINLPQGHELDPTVIFNHPISCGSIVTTANAGDRADLHERGDSQIVSLTEEWRKLLLHTIIANVCGNNIYGVLTHIRTDHIILVGASNVYIIPSQHVSYICYNIKTEE